MPQPPVYIKLTAKRRKQVEYWLNEYARKHQWKKRRRLQIIWFSDQKLSYKAIARHLIKVSYAMVKYNIRLYIKKGLKPFIG